VFPLGYLRTKAEEREKGHIYKLTECSTLIHSAKVKENKNFDILQWSLFDSGKPNTPQLLNHT
jgi:hypothetical protein